MLQHVREVVKRIPVFGTGLYKAYLAAFYREGEVLTVGSGRLAGKKMSRFMRTVVPAFIAGDHEIELQAAIERELGPGDVFFDVGSLGGFFSLLGAELVGANGHVVAFEPHPKSCTEIRKQLSLNAMNHATVVQAAVTNRCGTARFADDGSACMLSLMELRTDRAEFSIDVDTTTLDQQVQEWGVPSVVKVDVEGAEALVLQGAHRLLSKHEAVWLIEMHGDPVSRQCREFMSKFDYIAYDLVGQRVPDTSFPRFLCFKKNYGTAGQIVDRTRAR